MRQCAACKAAIVAGEPGPNLDTVDIPFGSEHDTDCAMYAPPTIREHFGPDREPPPWE